MGRHHERQEEGYNNDRERARSRRKENHEEWAVRLTGLSPRCGTAELGDWVAQVLEDYDLMEYSRGHPVTDCEILRDGASAYVELRCEAEHRRLLRVKSEMMNGHRLVISNWTNTRSSQEISNHHNDNQPMNWKSNRERSPASSTEVEIVRASSETAKSSQATITATSSRYSQIDFPSEHEMSSFVPDEILPDDPDYDSLFLHLSIPSIEICKYAVYFLNRTMQDEGFVEPGTLAIAAYGRRGTNVGILKARTEEIAIGIAQLLEL